MRLLLTFLRLALALLRIAVAALVATGVRILTRTSTLFIAFGGIASTIRTSVTMVAAWLRRIAASLRVARPGFDRFGLGLWFGGQPAEYFFQDGRFGFFARGC